LSASCAKDENLIAVNNAAVIKKFFMFYLKWFFIDAKLDIKYIKNNKNMV